MMGKVESYADVDGGFYASDILEIGFDYWAYENTPNFLRNARDWDLKSPLLACESKARHVQTLRKKIGGKNAVIQRCSETDPRKGFRYIYYATFPRLKVYNGEAFRNGMFNLTIKYKKRADISTAEKISRSIRFKRKLD